MAIDRDDDADMPANCPANPPETPETPKHRPERDSDGTDLPEPRQEHDSDGAQRRARRDTDGPENTEPRARQLAEHARYRQVVEATYAAAAREKWAAAAPELQASWKEHKERYPERVRATAQTQPDGSWAGDGNRRLSPEQNAEAAKACADLRDEADQVILPAMRRVEVADPERHLAGLDHMLKGEDRLKEKIADYLRAPGVTVSQAVDKVPDAVRFTFSYPSERYADGVLTDMERVKSEGFELVKLKNLWHADQYKGVNSQWRSSDTGHRVEVQFHTPESLEAKELTHEAYERLRSKTATAAEERELEDFQRRVNALLATPPGTNLIKDFPE